MSHTVHLRGVTKRYRSTVALDTVTLGELKRYQAAGHFGKGSMAPKVEAAIRHIEAGGRRAIIAALEGALPALKGETGTHVVPG